MAAEGFAGGFENHLLQNLGTFQNVTRLVMGV